MSVDRRPKSAGVFNALPAVFDLQPTFEYGSFVPKSTREINDLAWSMAASQLQKAIDEINKRNPNLELLIKQQGLSAVEELLFAQFSREYDAIAKRVDEEQNELRGWGRPQLFGAGADTIESDRYGCKPPRALLPV